MREPGAAAPSEPAGREGSAGAVQPRDSATVMLLRPASEALNPGMEVYLLRRVPSMPFAPGAYAFPGGGVDPRDAERATGWAGPGPQVWAQRLGVPVEQARALVCAAVRETFEESGVLLAGASDTEVVTDTRGADWERDRHALLERSLSLAELLERRGLLLRSDLLCPWSRWITPPGESRRFDTRFFAAALPYGQHTRDVGGESDHARWYSPATAVATWEEGSLPMLPPTVITLHQLAECGSVTEALHPGRDLTPVEPQLRHIDGQPRIVLPDGTAYPIR